PPTRRALGHGRTTTPPPPWRPTCDRREPAATPGADRTGNPSRSPWQRMTTWAGSASAPRPGRLRHPRQALVRRAAELPKTVGYQSPTGRKYPLAAAEVALRAAGQAGRTPARTAGEAGRRSPAGRTAVAAAHRTGSPAQADPGWP